MMIFCYCLFYTDLTKGYGLILRIRSKLIDTAKKNVILLAIRMGTDPNTKIEYRSGTDKNFLLSGFVPSVAQINNQRRMLWH